MTISIRTPAGPGAAQGRPLRRLPRRHLAAALIALACAAGAPFVLPGFDLGLLAIWLPLVILAISVDLLWSENRIVSFGHGAFFAGGGYIAGLLLRGPAADTSGSALSMLRGASEQRPLFNTVVHALAQPAVAGIPVMAFVLPVALCAAAGWLIGRAVFRLGSAEVYAPLVTLGIGVIAAAMFLHIPQLGGSNGLSGIPGYTRQISADLQAGNYYFNLAWTAAVIAGYAWFRRSIWGRRWRAAGDDPIRLEALGVPVPRYRAAGFAVSAALAGLAGAIYVGTYGFMSADLASVTFSVQILIWIAVGGPGTLAGPILGVLAVQFGEQYLSDRLDYYWQLLLGLALIALVLGAPQGLAGLRRATLRRSGSPGGQPQTP
jgi:ABC-type branched-subunit amino acid transport system permease subunit